MKADEPDQVAAAAAAASCDGPQERPRTRSTGHHGGHDDKGDDARHGHQTPGMGHAAAHRGSDIGSSLSALSITELSTDDPPSVAPPSPKRAFEAPRVSWDPAR